MKAMKVKASELHDRAMALSQEAKFLLAKNDFEGSRRCYAEAATIEAQVVASYEKKRGLEKTKAILYRSAAFLCLKAGMTGLAPYYSDNVVWSG